MKKFIFILATVGGLGCIPLIPGTFGSLAGIPLAMALYGLSPAIGVFTIVAFLFAAAWISAQAQELFGEQDPQRVVIDEVGGLLVTLFGHALDPVTLIGGFILFRLFDVVKPFPCRWMEQRFTGGWGIVLDDVMAGIYANAALWLVVIWLPKALS